jgi:uncharacterized cupin superfamily protein
MIYGISKFASPVGAASDLVMSTSAQMPGSRRSTMQSGRQTDVGNKLEQRVSIEGAIKFGAIGNANLGPSPIASNWILEGTPTARSKFLSGSADGTATTWLWDCTAGKFNWFYDVDETVYLIDGSVIIKDHAGATRHLHAGDTVFFPAGSSAEWTVETYVRKIAFLRVPLPRQVLFAKRVYHSLKRLVGSGRGGKEVILEMFSTG